eukprot:718614_1
MSSTSENVDTKVSVAEKNICGADSCTNPAKLQCPTCIKMKLAPAWFCGQDCFRKSWKIHNKVHKEAKRKLDIQRARTQFKHPNFSYTGPLRPHYVSPLREVPAHIERPDYADEGIPTSEMNRRGNNKIDVKTPEEIEIMREVCRLGREVLDIAGHAVRPGITTEEIDIIVHEACMERKCYPSPLNYHSFPKSCCTSVNEVICHGIPDARKLEDGDIVNIDITVYFKGHHGDLNETFLVGNVEQKYKNLVKTAYESMMLAFDHVQPGVMVRDFGKIISKHVAKKGYSVVRSYCGHGIGKLFHCAPNVPHYAKNKAIGVLAPGHTFTIEPMINMEIAMKKYALFALMIVAISDNFVSADDNKLFTITALKKESLADALPGEVELSVDYNSALERSFNLHQGRMFLVNSRLSPNGDCQEKQPALEYVGASHGNYHYVFHHVPKDYQWLSVYRPRDDSDGGHNHEAEPIERVNFAMLRKGIVYCPSLKEA